MVKTNKRAGRKELDNKILELLAKEEPLRRKEIRSKTDELGTERTLTASLNRLQEGGLIRKIEKGIRSGRFALDSYIPPERARERMKSAIKKLSEKYSVVSLEQISEFSMVPKSWKFSEGGVEISFDDFVFSIARKINEDTNQDIRVGEEKKLKKGGPAGVGR